MAKLTQWQCDQCSKEETSSVLPRGWREVSYYNSGWQRFYLCGYECLTLWSEAREGQGRRE